MSRLKSIKLTDLDRVGRTGCMASAPSSKPWQNPGFGRANKQAQNRQIGEFGKTQTIHSQERGKR